MKKDMPLEGLRWSRDSGSALYDTPQNGRSRTGWGWGAQSISPLFVLLLETVCFNNRNTLFLYEKRSVSIIETNSS